MVRKKEKIVDKVVNTIDIFQERSHLFLKGKRTLPTTLGGLLTLGLISFIIISISSQVFEMFEYNNPKLYRITELEDTPSNISLNQAQNFFFAVQITKNDIPVNLSKESLFNFQTNLLNQTKLPNGDKVNTKYPIFWAPCNITDFPESLYGTTFSSNNLNLAYCMLAINLTDPDDGSCPQYIKEKYPDCLAPPNLNIQGGYFNDIFSYVQSNMVICDPNDPTLPSDMVCAQ